MTELYIFVAGLLFGAILAIMLRKQPPNPLVEPLEKLDARLRELEQSRARAQGELDVTLRSLGDAQKLLLGHTNNLVQALKAPHVRGRWGEVQLRRVVEIAGMVNYVDFTEQTTIRTEDGRLRPDMVIRLPNQRQIVVDSKAPLKAFLDALEAQDELTRATALRDHAAQVRTHLTKLAEKNYWRQFESAPEFVVCFLPGETFFSAALEQDPSLIEYGAQQKVILATPTTLIALLKAVAFGWNQERVARSAQEVSELGRLLYERLATMSEHFTRLGDTLTSSVRAYNQTLGSLESRVLPAARKFEELGAAGHKPLKELDPIDAKPRDPRQTGLDLE